MYVQLFPKYFHMNWNRMQQVYYSYVLQMVSKQEKLESRRSPAVTRRITILSECEVYSGNTNLILLIHLRHVSNILITFFSVPGENMEVQLPS